VNCLSKDQMKHCQHCGCEASLVAGDVIYPHRPDLSHKSFYLCQCGAYVGTHPGTTNPLGRPSNAELRKAKAAAHALFDPIWKTKQMGRSAAYKWLGEQLGITPAHVHIGWFDLETCNRVIEICKKRRAGAGEECCA
jgi:hypothetical protein